MRRRRQPGRKNDFFYAALMFAIFAVMAFNVAAEYFAHTAVLTQIA